MSAFFGMRGNGDWATDQRPKNWRQGVLRLYPNGDAPLTAIMSMMKEEPTDDPEFNWWTKSLPSQAGTVTNVYTDAAMSSAYSTGGAVGDLLYVKVAEAVADEFRSGHQALLRNTDNYADDCNCKVVAVTKNGASSRLTVKLLQADPTTTGIADCDRILVIGNINPEGGYMPDAIAYDPSKHYNYTQIFRTPLSITRTARKTRLRTGDQYKEAKRECLELHSIEQEKAYIWGVPTETVGDNGKPERTTRGLISFISSQGGLVSDFSTDSDFTDSSWLEAGEEWLDTQLETVFRYGGESRLALCGSGVILALNTLVKNGAQFQYSPTTTSYGIKVVEWVTPFGTIYLKRHPLFSYEVTNRNSMVILDPSDLKYRYIDDTDFYDDPPKKNTGRGRVDGTDEEYLTEAGLEYHHPAKTAYLNGFGQANGTPT
jgi:hypothetical protein